MADSEKNTPDTGVVGRLAERGEDAVTRLMDELGRNSRVTEALARAMGAKGKLDSASRTALTQIGLAAADEIKDLRGQLERLEKRLAKLEGASGGTGTKRTAKRSETKKTPTAKTRTRKAAKADEPDVKGSPAPGRALGGGTARGGTASRGTP